MNELNKTNLAKIYFIYRKIEIHAHEDFKQNRVNMLRKTWLCVKGGMENRGTE